MKLKYYSGAQVTSIIEKLPDKEYIDMLNAFAKEPSADVVEVVRCKECIHNKDANRTIYVLCECVDGLLPIDWFCADGERRKE